MLHCIIAALHHHASFDPQSLMQMAFSYQDASNGLPSPAELYGHLRLGKTIGCGNKPDSPPGCFQQPYTALVPPYADIKRLEYQLHQGLVTPVWVLFTLFLHIFPENLTSGTILARAVPFLSPCSNIILIHAHTHRLASCIHQMICY